MTTSDEERDRARTPGGPRHLPAPLLLSLLAIALAALTIQFELTVRRPDRGLFSFDSAEYALAGRHLARSGTLATPFAEPILLHSSGPPYPLLVGHPLVPLLDAALFRLGGERAILTLVPPVLAFLVLVWLTALLALRVSGSRGAAFAAGLAMALAQQALLFACDGVSELPFAVCWMVALLLLADFPARPRAVWLGIALGLAHLTRPVLAPLLPVWLAGAWLLAPRPRRWLRALLVAVAFAPFALVLLAYKRATAGDAFTDPGPLLMLAYLRPEWAPERLPGMLELPRPLAYIAAHPGALLRKVLFQGVGLVQAALKLAGTPVSLLFLLHLATPGGRAGGRELKGVVLALGAGLYALTILTVPSARFLFPMLPVVLALGVAEAWLLARARGVAPALSVAACLLIALLVSAYPTALAWRSLWHAPDSDPALFTEREWRSFGDGLAARLPRGALVTSDVGPWLAWYARCDAIQLPDLPRDLPLLAERQRLDAVVLTNHWALRRPAAEAWRAVFEGRSALPGWRPADSLAVGRLRALVLRPASPRLP